MRGRILTCVCLGRKLLFIQGTDLICTIIETRKVSPTARGWVFPNERTRGTIEGQHFFFCLRRFLNLEAQDLSQNLFGETSHGLVTYNNENHRARTKIAHDYFFFPRRFGSRIPVIQKTKQHKKKGVPPIIVASVFYKKHSCYGREVHCCGSFFSFRRGSSILGA